MSELKAKIEQDLKQFQKERKALEVAVRRLLLSEIHNKEIDLKRPLTDEETIKVLAANAKKHEDSIAQFKAGQREDLVSQEEQELSEIRKYLPEAMSDQEIQKLVDDAVLKLGGEGTKNMGMVIKEVMAQAKGRASGATVSQMVKQKLAN
ncbi:GatB/YqeY domain-containing protein [bacterium]|nr:MAG: GatB/YqeY domain-containing protein [bacterium]